MINIGSVAVSVVPSAEGFREKLEAQLRDLPSVKVTLETAAAETKIEEIRAALDSIRNQHVSVDVDDHGSAARTRASMAGIGSGLDVVPLKIAAIIAGLIALIPIAAAASGALAGIGAGIGIGAVGAGIGLLALGPVFKALSAQKSAGGGGGGGSSGLQVSQALNTQRQAEIGLAVAQRNAVDAQQALTQARVDASQALRDLSDQVIDNGLAQRQAVLDLAAAQQNLSVANANPDVANAANANALAQVQLQYDQASQSLTELKEKGTQLAAQKAAADQAGVDGSQTVIAAQNQVVDSQNALAQAQFQVANSAAQVQAAQGKAAGATSAYAAAVAKLNPAQKEFLGFLQSIKGQFSQLSSAASSGFLPGLQTAISNMLPVLPAFAGFIGKIASAFGDLAVNASNALTSPFWAQFFAFLDRISSPAIGLFGSIIGNLFQVLAAAFQAFWPAIDATGRALDGWLGRLATSIQGGSLDGFTNYVKDNLPRVGAFFHAAGSAIGNLVSALAPLGGHLLDGLTVVLDKIGSLPPGVLQALAVGTIGAGVAGKVASPVLGGIAKLAAGPEAGGALGLIGANPEIAAGVAAAAALAAGFTILYIKSKTFHDFVNDKLLPVLKKIGSDALEGIRKGLGFVGDALQRNKPQLEQLLHAFEDIAGFIVTEVLPILGPILKFYFEALGVEIGLAIDYIGFLVDAFNGVVNAGKTTYAAVSGFVKDVVGAITGIPGKLLGFGKSFLDAGSSLMNSIFDGIKSAAGSATNFATDFAKDVVNAVIRGMNTILSLPLTIPKVDTHIPGIGTVGGETLIPRLPEWRAAGGPVVPGHTYGVNELGTELFTPMIPGFITTAADTQKLVQSLSAMRDQPAGGKQITQHFQLPMTDPVAIAYTAQRLVQFA